MDFKHAIYYWPPVHFIFDYRCGNSFFFGTSLSFRSHFYTPCLALKALSCYNDDYNPAIISI